MEGNFYLYATSLEALLSEECSIIMNAMWSQDEKTCLIVELNNGFDEWDIEKYVRRFNELCVEELRIVVCKDKRKQPTYKQIMEVQGALEHFANFDAYDEKGGFQKFHTNMAEIYFYSDPIR